MERTTTEPKLARIALKQQKMLRAHINKIRRQGKKITG